jgi:predicted PurR-regulated permease PerM
MTETRFRQVFLLLLVTAISAAFVAMMIRACLLTILLAAIFTALSYPVYQWLLRRLRGREALAAIATLVLLLALVMAPLLAVLGAGANEALRVTATIGPRLQHLVDQPGEFDSRLRALPGYDRIEPYRAQILTKAGELVGSTSAFLFAVLSATTLATAVFFFHFFVLLYTMFFFLTGGPGLL